MDLAVEYKVARRKREWTNVCSNEKSEQLLIIERTAGYQF